MNYIYYYVGRNGKNQFIKDYVWTSSTQTYQIWVTENKNEARKFVPESSFCSSGFAKCFKREEHYDKKFVVVSGFGYVEFNSKLEYVITRERATKFSCREDAATLLTKAALEGFTLLSIAELPC